MVRRTQLSGESGGSENAEVVKYEGRYRSYRYVCVYVLLLL